MKRTPFCLIGLLVFTSPSARAHDLPHLVWTTPSGSQLTGALARAEMAEASNSHPDQPAETWLPVLSNAGKGPAQAVAFGLFSPAVKTRWDDQFLYIESNGLPAHNMMVGITAWQQQVPLPQKYTDDNAWRIPLHPVPAKEPQMIKGHFLRGAIAIAANGIPIFNPQNNRGEISQEIGELDHWGGHCGRADDYHYHIAPLHLQKALGKDHPVAYALDGYPIFGLTEPDGSVPKDLDALHGHTSATLGYHYHATEKYPYVIGGFHGEVVEREGQVDPQPRAQSARGAGAPLRGAKITGFEPTAKDSYKLSYEAGGEKRAILYTVNPDNTLAFEYQNGNAGTTKETYTRREGGGGGGGGRPGGQGGERGKRGGGPPQPPEGGGSADRPPRPEGEPGRPRLRDGAGNSDRSGPRPAEGVAQETVSPFGPDALKKPNPAFVLTSPEVPDGGALPMDYTGDGSGATLPLSWKGAPAGTTGYALIMDHLAPGNLMKHYWTMWDIPATTTSLPKNARDVGKLGTSFKGRIGYEPPHSSGPGAKTYVITVYALSAPLQIKAQPGEVNRDVLLAAMKDKVLASSSLSVVYTRGVSGTNNAQTPRREAGNQNSRP